MSGVGRASKWFPYDSSKNDWVLHPLVQEHLEFWLIPQEQRGSSAEWARDHKLNESTVSAWRKHFVWRRELEKRRQELLVDSDQLQPIYDSLRKEALAGNVKAAETYLRAVGKFSADSLVIKSTSVQDLSDDELMSALDELQRRIRGDGDVGDDGVGVGGSGPGDGRPELADPAVGGRGDGEAVAALGAGAEDDGRPAGGLGG